MRKIILSIAGSLISINAYANTPAATTAPSNPTTSSVKSGTSTNWVEGARVEIIEVHDLKSLDVAPAIAEYYDSNGAPWDVIKLKKQNDASWYKKVPGLRVTGYLDIKEQGVHTLVVDIQTNSIRGKHRYVELNCIAKGNIESNQIINISHKEPQNSDIDYHHKDYKTPGPIFNAQNAIRLELEPGKYKFNTMVGCLPDYKKTKKPFYSEWKPEELTLGLRLKSPTAKKAELITPSMIVHKEK